MLRGAENASREPMRPSDSPVRCWIDGPGPTMSTSDSSRLMSITWPWPVRSRWRSAASTANAPRRPVTSSASAIGGSVGGPSGWPVVWASVDIASAIVPKPARQAYGPVCP